MGIQGVGQSAPRVLITTLVLLGCLGGGNAGAATYYIATNGSDSNNGTTSGSPWLHWTQLKNLSPGDSLVVLNGTYTSGNAGLPNINCGAGYPNGQSGKPITIQAQNERQAFLKSGGADFAFQMYNCSYWSIHGLQIQSNDFNGGNGGDPVRLEDSSHLTFKRNLVAFNNRYKNSHLLNLLRVHSSLVEENEFYYMHRKAILVYHSTSNVFRRNYCNSRNYGNIGGGYTSEGPECISIYPGDDNLSENNVAENGLTSFSIEATGSGNRNRFYGDVSLNSRLGLLFRARGQTSRDMPTDNVVVDFVAVNSGVQAIDLQGNKNTQIRNISVIGGSSGLVTEVQKGYEGDGQYSVFVTNGLVVSTTGYGFHITTYPTWGLDHANAYQNSIDFSPAASHPSITNKRAVDPRLGACKVWIPATSPLKGAGKGGADIGANVLYRYQDGRLTTEPLWEVGTGKFPCGAVVAGVNDVAGASCYDVHQRLNVQANGCVLPSDYGSQSAPVSSPRNRRIIEGR